MNRVFAQVEANGSGNAVGFILVEQQFYNEHTFHDAVFAQGILGRFRNDAFVGFAVDHDLPATGTDRVSTLAD